MSASAAKCAEGAPVMRTTTASRSVAFVWNARIAPGKGASFEAHAQLASM